MFQNHRSKFVVECFVSQKMDLEYLITDHGQTELNAISTAGVSEVNVLKNRKLFLHKTKLFPKKITPMNPQL